MMRVALDRRSYARHLLDCSASFCGDRPPRSVRMTRLPGRSPTGRSCSGTHRHHRGTSRTCSRARTTRRDLGAVARETDPRARQSRAGRSERRPAARTRSIGDAGTCHPVGVADLLPAKLGLAPLRRLLEHLRRSRSTATAAALTRREVADEEVVIRRHDGLAGERDVPHRHHRRGCLCTRPCAQSPARRAC